MKLDYANYTKYVFGENHSWRWTEWSLVANMGVNSSDPKLTHQATATCCSYALSPGGSVNIFRTTVGKVGFSSFKVKQRFK